VANPEGLKAGFDSPPPSPGTRGTAASLPNVPPAAQYRWIKLINRKMAAIHCAIIKLIFRHPTLNVAGGWTSLNVFVRTFVIGRVRDLTNEVFA
jgi:hypothetical protein